MNERLIQTLQDAASGDGQITQSELLNAAEQLGNLEQQLADCRSLCDHLHSQLIQHHDDLYKQTDQDQPGEK